MPSKVNRKMSLAERVKARGDDLWPEDISAAEGELAPITILKQQASLLGRRTRNLVEAEVETGASVIEGHLRHTFFLVAPALNFYRHSLLEVEHEATQMYPATIKLIRSGNGPSRSLSLIKVKDSEGFKKALKRVFADDKTKRAIGSLLAQSGAAPSGS